jgi:glucose-1-phosphate thymidylyltransferase
LPQQQDFLLEGILMAAFKSHTRKGIILAGGSGTRLHPVTVCLSKQLLPVYDKPMIYYPLSTLMLAGIREFLMITTPRDIGAFNALLGTGSQWGIDISYAQQREPGGIAQALLIGEEFAAGGPIALILGDNIFYGQNLSTTLQRVSARARGATIFGYHVHDPERYGVAKFRASGKLIDIVEKPRRPPSSYAVTGIYFYDRDAADIARSLRPSARGELEITDVNRCYLRRGDLQLERLGRGTAWLDTGTHDTLLDAANFVRIVEERQNLKIACIEEVAFRMNLINSRQLRRLAAPLKRGGYGRYLLQVIRDLETS